MITRQAHDISARRNDRSAFTLIELLASLGVVAVLIALLLPTLGAMQQATERVVCSSNVRQLGLGMVMYSDSYDGQLPHTRFISVAEDGLVLDQETVIVRLGLESPRSRWQVMNQSQNQRDLQLWDGLGLLFSQGYLPSPGVFYCPSHFGDHELFNYADVWADNMGEIVANYQYRGMGANFETDLYKIDPRTSSLVSDAFKTEVDFNHETGANVLRADLAVFWFESSFDELLSRGPGASGASAVTGGPTGDLSGIWSQFDNLAPTMGRGRTSGPVDAEGDG